MSKEDILQFFRIVYGENAPGYLTIWNRKNFRTKWIEASHLEEAAQISCELALKKDVYFGIGLRKNRLEETKRGTWEDVMGIPGFWLDVDVYDEAHVNKNLPESIDKALELLKQGKLNPTYIINSGHGLNLLYLFTDLWIFKDKTELLEARNLCFAFNNSVIDLFKKNGYHLDNVGNIDRVVRVPYTTNFKTEPVPVTVIQYNPESRYTLDYVKGLYS